MRRAPDRTWDAKGIAHHLGLKCQVDAYWDRHHSGTARDFTVDLREFSDAPRAVVAALVPEPTPLAPLSPSSNSSTRPLVTKFGVVQSKATRNITQADARVTDATLGVIAYDAGAYQREIESTEWQLKLHDKRAGSPTDLLNVSATLAALRCHEPVQNLSTYP